MSRGISVILRKELLSLLGSDRSILFLYGFVVFLWSFLFVGAGVDHTPGGTSVWLLPFSVIVVSNFSQGVFVSERLTGAIEILLTCGLSRRVILSGKMIFVWAMAVVMGLACMGLGTVWATLAATFDTGAPSLSPLRPGHLVLFGAAASFNTALVALLSIYLPNPRMSHLINFLAVAAIMSVYFPLAAHIPSGDYLLSAILLACAAVITAAVFRGADGERIARPVNM
ncbi:MAG: hypothetical protein GF331_07320 [Chitinivibrionales bacterium]|nr:hypothetical protein [Chitinivibrionales bacterium]